MLMDGSWHAHAYHLPTIPQIVWSHYNDWINAWCYPNTHIGRGYIIVILEPSRSPIPTGAAGAGVGTLEISRNSPEELGIPSSAWNQVSKCWIHTGWPTNRNWMHVHVVPVALWFEMTGFISPSKSSVLISCVMGCIHESFLACMFLWYWQLA